jgi:hypothetical protein
MLRELESDIQYMLKLSAQIASLREKLVWITDLEDEKNLNLERAEKINHFINTQQNRLDSLKSKWLKTN